MADRVKNAFETIQADELLKTKTMMFLQFKIQQKKKAAKMRKLVSVVAGLFLLVAAGIFSHDFYFTKNGYIDMDINPAVEIAINRFDRVVQVDAYNEDGQKVIDGLDILHKPYMDAVLILLDAIVGQGYVEKDGLVSVTLQLNDTSKNDKMLAELKYSTEVIVNKHQIHAQVDVFAVSSDLREDSYEMNITPAKYLAILELQKVNPEITVESCKHHSISHIKRLARNGVGQNSAEQNNTQQQNERNNEKEHCGMCTN